uniref:Enoyl reductase (ER) domain-containing protein n=1 Tax=Trieres chinensis TaxID=1514140 RepID=A0A7S1Z666_TRICV|mmetsp:Transcript_18390/g.37292  ORF Transcript_18390/g.37292 Transcript_18390/m.37292 type:complete len:249 (+) Transcript_18390:2-748(+)
MMPVGGMAEFMVVDTANAVAKPDSVDFIQAAACASAVTSLDAVDFCNEGDRVLVLGGSGGVGSSAITLAKAFGASFVATTSTQEKMCLDLGADEVINYKEKNWWEIDEFRKEKFDVIIDTVGGGNFYGKAVKVLKTGKKGGKFVAVTGDDNQPDLSSWFKVLQYISKMPWRPLYTSIRKRKYPKFILLLPGDYAKGLTRILNLMSEEKLKIALDPGSPHAFSEAGVKEAFKIQGSGHAHGKVVVTMEN